MGWFMAAYHTGLDLIVPGQLVIRDPASKAGGLLDQGSYNVGDFKGPWGPNPRNMCDTWQLSFLSTHI